MSLPIGTLLLVASVLTSGTSSEHDDRLRMSGPPDECEARSIALEKAYVHEVYEQISRTQITNAEHRGRAWPKVKQFLADLEPGSIVCDIGCGNGKYLNVNSSVMKIGVDRCQALVGMAKEKNHEVLLCDNLSLPFRDESFDAVVSIAVVHHFATTERRVGAIRELARVLRIGGRIVISVWAMEHRHRKFESQDVLVPWHKPQHLSTSEFTSTTTTSEDDGPYHQCSSGGDSCRTGVCQRKRVRTRHKGRSIDPSNAPYNSSPSSSSLSSPNETCYSFVRRALQKLAGGKRNGSESGSRSGHKPWFLESWSSCTKDTPPQRYDPEGCEDCENDDIQDLPIELRRLEEEQTHESLQRRQTFTCTRQPSQYDSILNHKSKSLSDILTIGQRTVVRSRSSVSSLNAPLSETGECSSSHTSPSHSTTALSSSIGGSKPRLVKQKKSLCEEGEEEVGEEEVEEGRDKPTDMRELVKALPNFKVSTLGGSKKSANVFKQSSMNEELMSAERLREKERVRQNIQKQASLNEELIFRRNKTLDSLKDTFFSTSTAKRFQLLKNGLTSKLKSSTTGIEKVAGTTFKNGFVRMLQGWKGGEVPPTTRTDNTSTYNDPVPPCTPPPDCNNRRYGSSSTSSSVCDDRKDGTKPGERRHSREEGSDSSKDSSLQSDTSVDSEDSFASVIFVPKPDPPQDVTAVNNTLSPPANTLTIQNSSPPKSPQPVSPKVKMQPPTPPPQLKQPPPIPESVSLLLQRPSADKVSIKGSESVVKKDTLTPEVRHVDRLRQIQELLKSKTAPVTSRMSVPGFSTRSAFPLVRRCSTSIVGPKEPLARPLPRLLSLELFNPETDDMDSDSSGVSSPDSVSSVISVLQEEPTTPKVQDVQPQLVVEDVDSSVQQHKTDVQPACVLSSPVSAVKLSVSSEKILEESPTDEPEERVSPSISLLEAAADVASTLEDAVDAVIKSSPRARRRQLQLLESSDTLSVLQDSYSSSGGSSSWSLHKSDSSSRVSPVNPNKVFQKYNSGSDWSINSKCCRSSGVSPVTDSKNNNWYVNKPEDTVTLTSPKKDNSNSENYGESDTWDEDCRQHLMDFAEKLSQKLLEEIDQYRQQMCQQSSLRSSSHSILETLPEGFQDDPYLSRLSEELHDLTRLSEELQERNSYLATLNNNSSNESLLYSGSSKSCSRRVSCYGTESLQSTKAHSAESLDRDSSFHSYKRLEEDVSLAEQKVLNEFVNGEKRKSELPSWLTSESIPEDFNKCVDVRDRINEQEYIKDVISSVFEKDTAHLIRKTGSVPMLRLGHSMESNDAGDISERTVSGSDSSRGDAKKDTDSTGKTPSTTSLGPESSDAGSEKAGYSSDCSRDMRFADRRMARCDGRSSSEEAPPKGAPLIRQKAAIQEPPEELMKTESCASSLSGSTSQDSLPSDSGGGSITFHRYYHVFREGELDQLIEKYVDNLHIISSYYDHANWCIVAEKVQVWTI